MVKLFAVSLLWTRVFGNKNCIFCLCKKKPKDRITIISLQFAVVHLLQKNKDNTLVLLELHYVQLHAICTILFLCLGIHTQYLLYTEKPVLCMSHSLVLYFLSESMVFLFRLFYLVSIYLRSRGFVLLWVNAICLKCNFAFPYMH